jgi:hypothetical protein
MTGTKNKRNRGRAERREKTLLKKVHGLGTFPGIDVAVIIPKRGRYSIYTSTNQESSPPTMAGIVSRVSISLMYLTNAYNSENLVACPYDLITVRFGEGGSSGLRLRLMDRIDV